METHLSFDDGDLTRHCSFENGKTPSHVGNFEEIDGVDVVQKGADLCPMTPVPRRKKESGFIIKSVNCKTNDEVVGLDESPRTPKEGVFNPFAPGPDELCKAPFCKKVAKVSSKIVARRLDFDDVSDIHPSNVNMKEEEIELEKMLWEMVYETFLEAILLKQTEDFLAETQGFELDYGCRTPTSPVLLNGMSETCPDAPAKGTGRKLLNIDPGLCRKLEF